ncbi:MAG TPA: FGGY family carbohydrate kinase [Ilumatobacteraceae bacterium]
MSTSASILVIDVGTSGLRAAVVRPDVTVEHVHYRAAPPSTPFPGLVEFDAGELAASVVEVATAALAEGGPVGAVGIANQRASTIVWDRSTGEPVGPALGWQDLRTVIDCIVAKAEHGLAIAPNQSITKAAWLLNTFDAERARDLCFGTVDTWVAWVLSDGALHVTDRSNAAVTGMLRGDATTWDERALEAFRIPATMLPVLVDSTGLIGEASVLPGSPPICGIAGDQQASLIGQGCVTPGRAKATFGTGGMLDLCTGTRPPAIHGRSPAGTFPIVAWTSGGEVMWGTEAIMLSAGSNVEWLRDDLGIIATAAESHDVAAACETADGVMYVPALLGLGTPQWDYGARGTMLGITRGTSRPHIVRAVLEGVAHRGADLLAAAEADSGLPVPALRIDGGMSANPTFVQALADAIQRPVEVSPVTEATTLGAAFLAGLAIGTWSGMDDIAASWCPARSVEPAGTADRERWADAVRRAGGWIPDLSALDF